TFLRPRRVHRAALERHQLAVTPEQTRANAPCVEPWHHPQARNQQDNHRHDEYEHAVCEAGEPERQRPIEKSLAGFVIARRVVADAKLVFERRWKFACAPKETRAAMDFTRRF